MKTQVLDPFKVFIENFEANNRDIVSKGKDVIHSL